MRNTPKVRLRHDNSQIQFEPIASSPSNPFNQQSQILTDRQKEMVDRQRLTTGLFANMGATSPLPEPAPSPMEIHSDAPSADDSVSRASRTTPSKSLTAIGPMDMFLGSSPTPHARKSARQIESDATSVATPTAIRTADLASNDDLGSSPPRFDKIPSSMVDQIGAGVRVGSSFTYRQPESLQSFDEGTTLDEEALLAAELQVEQPANTSAPDDTVMSELPSSIVDVQLTAQIDAELQALEPGSVVSTDEMAADSTNGFIDTASHQPSYQANTVDSEAIDLDDLPFDTPEFNTSSTSRIGDSFSKSPTKETRPSKQLRRSSRNSATSSPAQAASGKKRKQTAGKKGKKGTVEEGKSQVSPVSQKSRQKGNGDDMLDNIVVASPKKQKQNIAPQPKKHDKGRKRKSMGGPASAARVVMAETSGKTRALRRSQSLLSQVENSQDILVEDTPAPKRARGHRSHDVSEAKRRPSASHTSTELDSSQTKRLSHVQVTPKRPADPVDSTVVQQVPHEPELASEGATERAAAAPETRTPSRSFAERVILTPRSIINQLKSLKDYLFSTPQLVLGREEEREIDNTLFDIRRQVLIAGLRGEENGGDAL